MRAAVRPAGAVWQAPVDISEQHGASGAEVAVDAQGNAVAVWSHFGKVQSAVRPAGGAWQTAVDISGPETFLATGAQVAVDPQGSAVPV